MTIWNSTATEPIEEPENAGFIYMTPLNNAWTANNTSASFTLAPTIFSPARELAGEEVAGGAPVVEVASDVLADELGTMTFSELLHIIWRK